MFPEIDQAQAFALARRPRIALGRYLYQVLQILLPCINGLAMMLLQPRYLRPISRLFHTFPALPVERLAALLETFSAENKTAVARIISQGFDYVRFHG